MYRKLEELLVRDKTVLRRYSTDPLKAVSLIFLLEQYCNGDFTPNSRSFLANWLKQQISHSIENESNALLAFALYICNKCRLPDRSLRYCKTLQAICRDKIKKVIFGSDRFFRIDFHRIYDCMKSLNIPKRIKTYIYFDEEFEFFNLNFSSEELTYLLTINDVKEPYIVSPSIFASKESPYMLFEVYDVDDTYDSYVKRKHWPREKEIQFITEVITIDDEIEVITIDDDTDAPSKNCEGKDTFTASSSKRKYNYIDEETEPLSKKCRLQDMFIAKKSKRKNSDEDNENTPSKKCKR